MKLKRILAAALCLLVMAAILPTAAFAEGARKFTITFKTADEKNAGTDSDVWAVIWYDDYGWDTFRSPLLDNPGNDFKRGGTDHYTFDIPDRPIKHVVIEYEDAEWKLDYVEFDRVRYDSMKDKWLMDDGSFMINVDDPNATTPDTRQFTIGFKTADETDAGTDGDVWAVVWYDDEGKDICKSKELDSAGDDFERGQLDYYTFEIPDRPIKHVVIEYEDVGWKLDYIEFDGVQYFLPIDKWLDGDGSYKIDVTEETQLPADAVILTFCTGDWDEGGTDDIIVLTFYYKDPNTGEIETIKREVETAMMGRIQRFEANQIDEVVVRGLPTDKQFLSVDINCFVGGWTSGWDLEWVRINKGDIIQCHYVFEGDYQELMVFPGMGLVEKTLNLYVGEQGTTQKVYAKIGFEDGSETGYFKVSDDDLEECTQYYKVLKVPDKPVKYITVKTVLCHTRWYLEYMNFDNNHFSTEYEFPLVEGADSEKTFYPLGSEPSDAGSVFGDANMGIIICVGAAVIVIAAAAVIVGVRKKKKSAGSAE